MPKSLKKHISTVCLDVKQMSHEHPARGESIDLGLNPLYFNSVNSVSSVAKIKEIGCPSH